jgi:hypothetical protein
MNHCIDVFCNSCGAHYCMRGCCSTEGNKLVANPKEIYHWQDTRCKYCGEKKVYNDIILTENANNHP